MRSVLGVLLLQSDGGLELLLPAAARLHQCRWRRNTIEGYAIVSDHGADLQRKLGRGSGVIGGDVVAGRREWIERGGCGRILRSRTRLRRRLGPRQVSTAEYETLGRGAVPPGPSLFGGTILDWGSELMAR